MCLPQPYKLIQEAGGGVSSRPVAPPGGKPLVKRCHKAKGELSTHPGSLDRTILMCLIIRGLQPHHHRRAALQPQRAEGSGRDGGEGSDTAALHEGGFDLWGRHPACWRGG